MFAINATTPIVATTSIQVATFSTQLAMVPHVLDWMTRKPNPGYSSIEIHEVVGLYVGFCTRMQVNPLLALVQMIHETANLKSPWSQIPHRNPAGIGVTGAPGVGVSFPSWSSAVLAHVGRLCAYAMPEMSQSRYGSELTVALSWRPLPKQFKRGGYPLLKDLTGVWATDRDYHNKIIRLGEAIFR